MDFALQPVSSASFVSPTPANSPANAAAISAYEQILLLESNNSLNNSQAATFADDSSLNTADLLNLSPAALEVLNGIQSVDNADAATISTAGSVNTTTGATLTPEQQQQVTAIVSQFAGQPLTAQTFTEIQTALSNAGIDPQQLSIQQLLEAYNYAYVPAYSFNEQAYSNSLAEELAAA